MAKLRIAHPIRGHTVIDQNYQNFALSAFGSPTMRDPKHPNVTSPGYFECRAKHPLFVMPIYPYERTKAYEFKVSGYDIDRQVAWCGLASYTNTYPDYVFVFDVPDFAIKSNNRTAMVIQNPETGETCFDSRCLYLDVLGFASPGMPLEAGKVYGYADLSGGTMSPEYFFTRRELGYEPWETYGYVVDNGRLAGISTGFDDPYERRKTLAHPLYRNFRPHLLVDLTAIYNSYNLPKP